MKLLFDEHISFRVVRDLQDVFPEAKHVNFHGLNQEPDEAIWHFAKTNGYTIVTRDDDFHQRSLTFGHPPKVIWMKIKNCDRVALEAFLRKNTETIQAFVDDQDAALLALGS